MTNINEVFSVIAKDLKEKYDIDAELLNSPQRDFYRLRMNHQNNIVAIEFSKERIMSIQLPLLQECVDKGLNALGIPQLLKKKAFKEELDKILNE